MTDLRCFRFIAPPRSFLRSSFAVEKERIPGMEHSDVLSCSDRSRIWDPFPRWTMHQKIRLIHIVKMFFWRCCWVALNQSINPCRADAYFLDEADIAGACAFKGVSSTSFTRQSTTLHRARRDGAQCHGVPSAVPHHTLDSPAHHGRSGGALAVRRPSCASYERRWKSAHVDFMGSGARSCILRQRIYSAIVYLRFLTGSDGPGVIDVVELVFFLAGEDVGGVSATAGFLAECFVSNGAAVSAGGYYDQWPGSGQPFSKHPVGARPEPFMQAVVVQLAGVRGCPELCYAVSPRGIMTIAAVCSNRTRTFLLSRWWDDRCWDEGHSSFDISVLWVNDFVGEEKDSFLQIF